MGWIQAYATTPDHTVSAIKWRHELQFLLSLLLLLLIPTVLLVWLYFSIFLSVAGTPLQYGHPVVSFCTTKVSSFLFLNCHLLVFPFLLVSQQLTCTLASQHSTGSPEASSGAIAGELESCIKKLLGDQKQKVEINGWLPSWLPG